MSDYSLVYGRSLLKEEVGFELTEEIRNRLCVEPAFIISDGRKSCARCSTCSELSKPYPCICGGDCLYCRECIVLGKVRECAQLYSLPEPNQFDTYPKPYLKWNGKLSDQQSEASIVITKSITENKELIVWAVAGAGKTEMLFQGIQRALESNKRVCIASPRIDVCLELAPRIQRVFPAIPIAVLYGGAEEGYRYTQLVIATTHQLYRFKEAFDVVIIDEVDAFPYHMNAALNFATNKSRKTLSSLIYLTATPDKPMQLRMENKLTEAVVLPARYHGHALPVPKAVYQRGDLMDYKKAAQTRLIKHMKRLIELEKRFLIFVPTIALMEKMQPVFHTIFQRASFECVHSKDTDRKEKVQKMRNGELDFLMTTTILERGVTFENIDVIIWRADHHVYTEAALVQISGRVGRSENHPTGNVTFYHQDWTRAMKKALKQIRQMNHLAQKRGLIH
ncbi:DEAD/DEAH box helicase [Alkalibacterium sp. f15]|uniref:DEAD/DEAH box helicase n=1 Tax=Alkalibacterium sp. f15 TaxID=3414029 RepID=UPI003BF787AE